MRVSSTLLFGIVWCLVLLAMGLFDARPELSYVCAVLAFGLSFWAERLVKQGR